MTSSDGSEGKKVALARVVALEGSGPRLPGATMAVSEAGEVAGSVSGGAWRARWWLRLSRCSRAKDVPGCALSVTPMPKRSLSAYLGGTIRVFVEPLDW